MTNHLPRYPNYDILGRIRNLDVELFGNFTALQTELEGLDYTVRPYDRSKCMSIYPDTEVKNRNLVQKLQDQLYEALQADGEEIGYALIAATQSEWVLICKLDRVGNFEEGTGRLADMKTGKIQPGEPMPAGTHRTRRRIQHHRIHARQRRLHPGS